MAVYTVEYTCTRPCNGRVRSHGRVRAVYTTVYKAVYTGRMHGYTARTWPCTRVHGPYTAMVTARVHSRIQDRVDGRVLGHAHGRIMTVYTARVRGRYTAVYTNTRPIYKTYRICNFLTNSCCVYIRKESKAP